ncbi:MAG: flavodoxin family protein, partial [Lachnospiraceae bacterium]|nr:flavodoxin family protein [Lachnospiraceae bacterium]
HGRVPGEAEQDGEGLQTMRNLARNMAWMLKCFKLGEEQGISRPETERGNMTNFIR